MPGDYLSLSHVHVRYGAMRALDDVSLSAAEGEQLALLGANGAGKTTLFNALVGALRYSGNCTLGAVLLDRHSIRRRMAAGIGLVPEGRRVLARLSVEDNLRLGASCRRWTGATRAELAEIYDRFPVVADRRHSLAGVLSGGQQQMLAIARVMVSRPRVLLLDEPSLGLSPVMIDQVVEALRSLLATGLTLIVAEQNLDMAARLAERAYVLARGRVIYEGPIGDALSDTTLQAADMA